MDHKVVLMPLAMDDLEVITEHIAEDNLQAAERFGNELIDAATQVSKFPQMGRVVPEYDESSLREIIFKSYRIPYRLIQGTNEIHILRFWHSARGTPDL